MGQNSLSWYSIMHLRGEIVWLFLLSPIKLKQGAYYGSIFSFHQHVPLFPKYLCLWLKDASNVINFKILLLCFFFLSNFFLFYVTFAGLSVKKLQFSSCSVHYRFYFSFSEDSAVWTCPEVNSFCKMDNSIFCCNTSLYYWITVYFVPPLKAHLMNLLSMFLNIVQFPSHIPCLPSFQQCLVSHVTCRLLVMNHTNKTFDLNETKGRICCISGPSKFFFCKHLLVLNSSLVLLNDQSNWIVLNETSNVLLTCLVPALEW